MIDLDYERLLQTKEKINQYMKNPIRNDKGPVPFNLYNDELTDILQLINAAEGELIPSLNEMENYKIYSQVLTTLNYEDDPTRWTEANQFVQEYENKYEKWQ